MANYCCFFVCFVFVFCGGVWGCLHGMFRGVAVVVLCLFEFPFPWLPFLYFVVFNTDMEPILCVL